MTLDLKKILLFSLMAAGFAVVLALGFAGWLQHASDLLIAYGYAGIAWCL